MVEIYFGEFRLTVIRHIREIESAQPPSHTTAWFLLRYLRRIEKNANPPSMPGRMQNCMRGMIRFYVDQIDERSELGERCRAIYDAYVQALRDSNEEC